MPRTKSISAHSMSHTSLPPSFHRSFPLGLAPRPRMNRAGSLASVQTDARGGPQSRLTRYPLGPQLGTQAIASAPSPGPTGASATSPPGARGQLPSHLRGTAVAILISYRLDAAGTGYSDVAALKAQIYAHHRHGAGYCSGSGPGPVTETGHGPWRGCRAGSRPRGPRDRGYWGARFHASA